VLDRVSATELRQLAIEDGMRPLRQAGLLAIFDGQTTVEEIMRETIIEK
jgi:type IV pilus assembly protein PilB